MSSLARSKRRLAAGVTTAVVVMSAAVAYFAARSSGQPQVSADVLPLVARVHRVATYVDCSQIDAVTYGPHNPCQTFVLLESHHFRSAAVLLGAEAHQLTVSGWHHSAAQPVDYNQVEAMAIPSESWVAADGQACAYIATDEVGAAAEGKGLFPFDPNNQPRGVLDFYRNATAAEGTPTLWVRLEPNDGGRCVG
jgi:hypothetical protein